MKDIIFKRANCYFRGNIVDGRMNFSPYGGGFVRSTSESNFKENFEIVESIPNIIVPSWVNMDYYMPIKAFVNPHNRWNGWAQPMFALEDIPKVIKYYFGEDCKAERVENGYIITDSNYEEEPFLSEDFEIEVNGKKIMVNSLTDGWCWEMMTEIDAVCVLFMSEVARLVSKKELAAIDKENTPIVEGQDALPDNENVGDANMLMHKAFTQVFPDEEGKGSEMTDAKTDLWNAAWERARRFGYENGTDYGDLSGYNDF